MILAEKKGSIGSCFYEQLSDETKDLFKSLGNEIHVNKDSILFYEGDRPDHIYLILSGKVRLSKTSAEGKVFFLQTKNSYDLLGELSLFNELNYHCNAEVMEDSVLLRYKREEVEELISTNNELAVTYMKWLSMENNVTLSQFRDLIFCGKEGALYSVLIRLSNEYGVKVKSGILINRKVTNQEIGNHIGATRESINRILKRLINNKIISVNTKYITIHDIDYLKDHLRCHNCMFTDCIL